MASSTSTNPLEAASASGGSSRLSRSSSERALVRRRTWSAQVNRAIWSSQVRAEASPRKEARAGRARR